MVSIFTENRFPLSRELNAVALSFYVNGFQHIMAGLEIGYGDFAGQGLATSTDCVLNGHPVY